MVSIADTNTYRNMLWLFKEEKIDIENFIKDFKNFENFFKEKLIEYENNINTDKVSFINWIDELEYDINHNYYRELEKPKKQYSTKMTDFYESDDCHRCSKRKDNCSCVIR